MAEKKNTRKSSTKKEAPKKAEEVKVEETKTKEEPKKATAKESKAKVKLDKEDKISVMNNTTGRYGYIGRSGYSFELEEYGDITDIPFGELQAMRAGSQKTHLENAYIIILDEDAVEELNYSKLYENVLDSEGVEELLKDGDRLDKVIDKMPIAMKETVVSIAKKKFDNDELRDLFVIKTIEKKLNVKIMDR